jgi:hypothetical protein
MTRELIPDRNPAGNKIKINIPLQWNTFTCNRGTTWYHVVLRGTTWYHVVPTVVPTVVLRGTTWY